MEKNREEKKAEISSITAHSSTPNTRAWCR